jgi:hypothetical protein
MMVPAKHVIFQALMPFCKKILRDLKESKTMAGVLTTMPRGEHSSLLRLVLQLGRMRASRTWLSGKQRGILPDFKGFALGGPVQTATSKPPAMENSTHCIGVPKTTTQQLSVILI